MECCSASTTASGTSVRTAIWMAVRTGDTAAAALLGSVGAPDVPSLRADPARRRGHDRAPRHVKGRSPEEHHSTDLPGADPKRPEVAACPGFQLVADARTPSVESPRTVAAKVRQALAEEGCSAPRRSSVAVVSRGSGHVVDLDVVEHVISALHPVDRLGQGAFLGARNQFLTSSLGARGAAWFLPTASSTADH